MLLTLQDITPEFLAALKTSMAVAQGRRKASCWGFIGARAFFASKGLSLPRSVPQEKELRALHVIAAMSGQHQYARPAKTLPAFKGGMDAVIGYASKYIQRAFGASLREGAAVMATTSTHSPIRSLPGGKASANPTNRDLILEIQRLRQEMKQALERKSDRLSA